MSNPDNWRHKVRVLELLGIRVGIRVLDYGCGAGVTVTSLANAGFDAYGFDVLDYANAASNRIVIANSDRLPYPDGFFDMVFSDQVFEHAKDQDRVFAELHRVTRPGGVHMHVIPAKWQIIEPHIYVPLGGLIGFRWWYRVWATLGIRNEAQRGLDAAETAEHNLRFFREGLNYVSTRHYRRLWRSLGYRSHFVERHYMATSDKPEVRRLARIPGLLPLIRAFWVRIVVLERPHHAAA
jgi:SAM-dependent methyltransferase